MKYGQVNQETDTLTKPAMTVSVVANHHQISRVRKREISLRKKNKKAILTEKMTSHQIFVIAFISFEIVGISPSTLKAISSPRPCKTN